MTLSSARLAILAATLLMGCADDSSRLAGGTGSDLPKPVARLLDTNLVPVSAGTWRLWKISGDSAFPDSQFNNPEGFLIPPSGLWVVEAWMDSIQAGSMDVQNATTAPLDMGLCAHNLTYLRGNDPTQLGVQPCLKLIAPSSANGGGNPIGVGVFGSDSVIKRLVRITGEQGIDAYRFIVWKILRGVVRRIDPMKTDSVTPAVFHEFRYSATRGIVDIKLDSGDWVIEGWGGGGADTTWKAIDRNDTAWAEANSNSVLNACFTESYNICTGQILKSRNPGAAVTITVHVP